MGRMVMALSVLVVAIAIAAWGQENRINQSLDVTGKEIDGAVSGVASAEATPATAPTVTEADETTLPIESAAPAEPPGEENRESQTKIDAAAPQSHLDLDALEKRIRRTDSLGFFTKLALKNQVDDLLERFRAYHTGKSDLTIEQLNERYNLLLLKLVSLLEDGDIQLSRDILASRGAIWNVLADPEQFAKLQES